MKTTTIARIVCAAAFGAILGGAATIASAAGDYVDAQGCTHIDMGGYYNLGLEPGCGRVNREGGVNSPTLDDEEDDE
ncbi:hypothetical protein OEW28_18780 [Defluviimonas sp. WL0002]|uniref:Porin n=1 Tax=Albidovulum marisflavi TaxID=2984159 RepID=A0ABT2ZHZ6_9RHOB|nr:hypothetical protein [Defluviimonas sp. WL0002]MCV2870663.1 hypothetical protein [Defluviimonas sp. WL0002]